MIALFFHSYVLRDGIRVGSDPEIEPYVFQNQGVTYQISCSYDEMDNFPNFLQLVVQLVDSLNLANSTVTC